MSIFISSIATANIVMLITAILIAGGVIAVSSVFLTRALRRAKLIGMDNKVIMGAIRTSAIFSIVPSIPIVIGVAVMSAMLLNIIGIPWIRLTVIGALQYEITVVGIVGGEAELLSEKTIATAFIIMTIAIMSGPIFNAIILKKYQGKLADIREKNKKLLDSISGSLLGGLLAGIVSYMIVSGFNSLITGVNTINSDGSITIGAVTLLTLGSSVFIMLLCGISMKVFKWKWMENYALPITMLGSLALALLFQTILEPGASEAINDGIARIVGAGVVL
ncbi:MAG: DUF5058 family protein [Clostridia bacterium]|nr:DUF5058 family protein [Clostridia bacterium]